MKPFLFSVLFSFSITFNFAQQREIAVCGNEYNTQEIPVAELLQNNRSASTNGTIYKIPVVFHVLTDQPTGVSNISDCIIQDQINVLNNSFRRKVGTQGYNTNPVGADAEIEFYLARKNPSGGATNGINRVTTSNCNYTTLNDNTQLTNIRNAAKWPVNQYLNIWVLKTMPNNNTVRGQAFWGVNTNIGVLVHYSYVGSKNAQCPGVNLSYLDITTYKAYDLGMTLVHEIGHYLNLVHTYGSSCTFTDGCDDTPAVSGAPNAYCGTNNDAQGVCVSGQKRMWQNYMDYTDDACMNIFTICQVNKMRTFLTGTTYYNNLFTSTNFTATGGDIALSVNDMSITQNQGISIFPNPALDKITIVQKNISKAESYRLIDAYGKEIKRGFLTGNATNVDVNAIPKGIYFVEVKNSTYKFVKQ